MLDIWGDINPAFRRTRGFLIWGLMILIIRCFHLNIVSLGSPSLLINITVMFRTWTFAGKDPLTVINREGFLYSRLSILGRRISLPNNHVIGNI
jgi:hypothetical protein